MYLTSLISSKTSYCVRGPLLWLPPSWTEITASSKPSSLRSAVAINGFCMSQPLGGETLGMLVHCFKPTQEETGRVIARCDAGTDDGQV